MAADSAQAYILVAQFFVRVGQLKAENQRLWEALEAIEQIRQKQNRSPSFSGHFEQIDSILDKARKEHAEQWGKQRPGGFRPNK